MIDFSEKHLMQMMKGELEPADVVIGRIRLTTPYREIPTEEIIEIGLFDKATGKYLDNGSDYTFKERLKLLLTHNAFVHLAGGLTLGITDEKITQIRMTKKYMEPFQSFTKNEMESFHGKPEKELIEDTMWGMDYSLDSFISVYKNSMLYLYFEPQKLRLQEVRIGKVNEEFYTKK